MSTLWLRGWSKVDAVPSVKGIRTRMNSEENYIAKHFYLRISNFTSSSRTLKQELYKLVVSVKEDLSSYIKTEDNFDRSTLDFTFTLKNGETYRAVSAKENATIVWVNKL